MYKKSNRAKLNAIAEWLCPVSHQGGSVSFAALDVSFLSSFGEEESSWSLFECGRCIVGIKFYRTTGGRVLLTTFAEIQQTMEV
jgi:hypothetical protein